MTDADAAGGKTCREKAVIVFALVKAFVVLSINMLLVKLAYEGFKAGEMGIMAGILVSVMVVLMLPVTILLFVMVKSITQRKRWALMGSIIFTFLFVLVTFSSLGIGFWVFFPIFIALVLFMVLEIRLLPVFS